MAREYQIFIKPVGPACNLRCGYCYYNPASPPVSGGPGGWIMDDLVLGTFIRQNIEAAGEGPVYFAWHGGEPTLAGVGFYRRAVELQNKHRQGGTGIINGIQTNGTLLNREWCRFLADAGFNVGISLDGPANLHNAARVFPSGRGSFEKASQGFIMLKEYGLNPEILCVVSAINVPYPLEVYRFFREMGATWMTFLPLVIRDDSHAGRVLPPTVASRQFGEFLCRVFDEWIENDIGRIKVQVIEEATRVAFSLEHTLCIFKRECGGVPVVERNGDFYSCDHYVNGDYNLGNIQKTPLADLLDSERQRAFGAAKRKTLPRYCLECEVIDMCNGECPKNRFIRTPDGESGLNWLCEGYRMFFNHCRPFVDAVRAAGNR
ncbi:MAG: anaerobic sulfatase maturase [Bacteroidales bacterium]|nr:anaerobic sulfatase maturase [Bacteroidales bacterium]